MSSLARAPQAQQRLAFRGERMEKGVPDVDEIDAEVPADPLDHDPDPNP